MPGHRLDKASLLNASHDCEGAIYDLEKLSFGLFRDRGIERQRLMTVSMGNAVM